MKSISKSQGPAGSDLQTHQSTGGSSPIISCSSPVQPRPGLSRTEIEATAARPRDAGLQSCDCTTRIKGGRQKTEIKRFRYWGAEYHPLTWTLTMWYWRNKIVGLLARNILPTPPLLTVTLQSGDPAEISCCGGKYFPPDICYKTLSKFYTAQFVFCTGTQYCVVSWLSSKLPWVCRVLHYSSVHCTVGRAWLLYKMSCRIFITSLLHWLLS